MMHMLKLYPDGDAPPPPAHGVPKPVVSERYDEFVFNSPNEQLKARLNAEIVPSAKGWRNSAHAKYFADFDEPPDRLSEVYQAITSQLQEASKRRRVLEDEVATLANK